LPEERASAKRQKIRKALIFISFLFFPITIFYFSPVIIVQAALLGIINGSFIIFGLLFVASLVLGRAYCGWVCPGGGLGEACAMARDKEAPGGRLNWIKYFIWVPWIGVVIYFAAAAGGYNRIDFIFGTYHGISMHDIESYFVYFFFVVLIAILSWFPGRRGFCHYICWMAPFMVIGDWLRAKTGWPALQLHAASKQCAQCGKCAANCPMSLDVPQMVAAGNMRNSECILCGTCVDNCPNYAIVFAWKPAKETGLNQADASQLGRLLKP
jgi:ferredoxin-type protein NapH